MLTKIEIEIMASLGKHRVAREELTIANSLFSSLRSNCPHYFTDSSFKDDDTPYCNYQNSQRKCLVIACPLDPINKEREPESHPGVWCAG